MITKFFKNIVNKFNNLTKIQKIMGVIALIALIYVIFQYKTEICAGWKNLLKSVKNLKNSVFLQKNAPAAQNPNL